MGYRSDVAYTIRFGDDSDKVVDHAFYTFLAEAKSKPEYALALADEDLDIDEKRRRINFFAKNTKWYDSFPDVKSHVALVHLADEWTHDGDSNGCCAYVFMRIGEDDKDIEREVGGNYGYDWINLERRLATDWS